MHNLCYYYYEFLQLDADIVGIGHCYLNIHSSCYQGNVKHMNFRALIAQINVDCLAGIGLSYFFSGFSSLSSWAIVSIDAVENCRKCADAR